MKRRTRSRKFVIIPVRRTHDAKPRMRAIYTESETWDRYEMTEKKIP